MQNPWALLALAAAVLPWLFATRRRAPEPPKTIEFPALFLLTTSKKSAFRAQKRRKILLAVARSAALVALTFVWAEPFASVAQTAALQERAAPERLPTNAAPRVANGTVDGRPIRVLIVDGRDSDARRSRDEKNATPSRPSAAFYLAIALNPTSDETRNETQSAASQGFPNVKTTTSADFSLLSASELDAFDAILLAELSAPTSDEIEKFARFFKRPGKALVVCAGPNIRLERWNELWKRWNVDAKTFAVELDPARGTSREPFDVETGSKTRPVENQRDFEKEFRRPFEKTPNCGLDALPIWRAFPTVGPDVVPALRDAKTEIPLVAKIAAKSDSGVGDGALFWVATVPDEAASALAFAPIFVPLIERIVEFALSDALNETPQNIVKKQLNKSESSNVRPKSRAALRALWSVLAAAATFEILLAFPTISTNPTPRRRRLY